MSFKYGLWGDNWIPSRVPKSSYVASIFVVWCSVLTSIMYGFDQSMLNGLNILPSYTDYFSLTTVTLALNTASIWMGGCIGGLFFGRVTDLIGRKPSMFWAQIITLIAVIIQTAAQDIGMFVFARILLGLGNAASTISGPTYVAETIPFQWRAWGLAIFNDFFYVGALIAAGITYGTASINSTWAWRLPSIIQALFSISALCILPFIPESPRWLEYQGRHEEAHMVIAQLYSGGDLDDPVTLAQTKEIVDTIAFEKNTAEGLTFMKMVKTPNARKRIMIALSAGVFSDIAGNVIASYYLGSMLDNAGITNSTTQLKINIILNAWCLICSILGTYFINAWGRKPVAMLSTGLLTCFIFIIGGLTKLYGSSSSNKSGVYGTVAAIFLFQGSYSFGWTPLAFMYAPEVLNYSIRANGMGAYNFFQNAVGLAFVFLMPIGLDNIGWKLYMINGSWDILIILFIAFFWIETKGKTLEEIDEAIDGIKHSDVADLEQIINGNAKDLDFAVAETPANVD